MRRLLSDRLLRWKELILASYQFQGFLRTWEKPKAAHSISEHPIREAKNQNGRAATNPTQNSSTYTLVSFQFATRSIFPVKPTLSRSLLQKFPVWTFPTARVHIHLDTRPLKTSFVTLPPFKLSLAEDHTVTWHEQTVLEPRVPRDGVDPGEASFKREAGLQSWFSKVVCQSNVYAGR